jgi:hypothetical protein
MPNSRLLGFVIKELKEVLAPTLFFAIGFNIIVLTTQLILADYLVNFTNFMVATVAALVVGKSVLIANAIPFLRRFDTAPLIRPILFKTLVYWAVVFVVRLVEKLAEYRFGGGTLGAIPEYVAIHFSWHRFFAIQIWIFVLFLIYTSAAELNALFGDGELVKILFTRRSSELKLTRRQRIRALVKLSRLTEAHTLEELADRNTAAHATLIGIIGGLAMRKTPAKRC